MKLKTHPHPKHSPRMAIALLALCLLLAMPAALADGADLTAPEYATVGIEFPQVDIDAMIAAFYGEQAGELKLRTDVYEFDGDSLEVINGSLPDCEYAFSYANNSISMQRAHAIPLKYRSDGEGIYAPPPSKVEGKYTEAEAIELARQFVQHELGIATDTGLVVAEVIPEDAAKERSRAYMISFAYAWEGIPLMGTAEQLPQATPRLSVDITDEGIVSFSGDILALSGLRKGGDKLLPPDELKRVNPNDQMLANSDDMYLCYKVGPAHEGRLAWHAGNEGEPIPIDAYGTYDAYTGEKLL